MNGNWGAQTGASQPGQVLSGLDRARCAAAAAAVGGSRKQPAASPPLLPFQYEEPTAALQHLREGLEVQRMTACAVSDDSPGAARTRIWSGELRPPVPALPWGPAARPGPVLQLTWCLREACQGAHVLRQLLGGRLSCWAGPADEASQRMAGLRLQRPQHSPAEGKQPSASLASCVGDPAPSTASEQPGAQAAGGQPSGSEAGLDQAGEATEPPSAAQRDSAALALQPEDVQLLRRHLRLPASRVRRAGCMHAQSLLPCSGLTPLQVIQQQSAAQLAPQGSQLC